jgi:hypothetical protein
MFIEMASRFSRACSGGKVTAKCASPSVGWVVSPAQAGMRLVAMPGSERRTTTSAPRIALPVLWSTTVPANETDSAARAGPSAPTELTSLTDPMHDAKAVEKASAAIVPGHNHDDQTELEKPTEPADRERFIIAMTLPFRCSGRPNSRTPMIRRRLGIGRRTGQFFRLVG